MQIKTLTSFVKQELENSKASDIIEMDVSTLSNCMDVIIIVTATSSRHAKSIHKKLLEAVKTQEIQILGVEGESIGEWILIDLGDLVIHIMLKSVRDLYQLEKLWTITEQMKKNLHANESSQS